MRHQRGGRRALLCPVDLRRHAQSLSGSRTLGRPGPGGKAEKSLAKIHFLVAIAEKGGTLVAAGALLTLASMLIFLFTLATNRTA